MLERLAVYRVLLSCAFVPLMAAACAEARSPDAPQGTDGCPFPGALHYTAPGCGQDVKPTCVMGAAAAGACASAPVCGCDGQAIWGVCGLNAYSAPYQFAYDGFPDAGACQPAPGYDAGIYRLRSP